MFTCDWVEFLEFKLFVRMLLLVLSRVVNMPLTGAVFCTLRYEFDEFIL